MADVFAELQELNKQIEAEDNKEPATEPEKVEEGAAQPEAEAEEEAVAQEDDAAPEAASDGEEAAAEPEKPKDAAAAYKAREEKRVAKQLEEAAIREKALLDALGQKQAAQLQPQAPQRPDPNEDPDAARDHDIAELKRFYQEQKMVQFKEAFMTEVASEGLKLAQDVPDIKEVMDAGYNQMVSAMMLFNPQLTEVAAQRAAKDNLLEIAATAKLKGENPAFAIYEHFSSRGIKAPPPAEEQEQKGAAPKASEADRLKAVIKNKAKTGSPLTGGGTSAKIGLTMDKKLNMTPAEYMKLSAEDRAAFAGGY